MRWAGVVFVTLFCAAVYFLKQIILTAFDPEFISDMERFREQRRRRKAAKR